MNDILVQFLTLRFADLDLDFFFSFGAITVANLPWPKST